MYKVSSKKTFGRGVGTKAVKILSMLDIALFLTMIMCCENKDANDSGETIRDVYAKSIFVTAGTVYAAGYFETTDNFNPTIRRSHSCTWADATATILQQPEGGYSSHAYSVYVSGSDVYCAGYYSKACYWTGQNLTDLPIPAGASSPIAESIFVSGGTVYTVGRYHTATNWVACLWTGTIESDLPVPAGSGDSFARSVSIYGSDVYVAGWYIDGNYISHACEWKNGVRTDFTEVPSKAGSLYIDTNGDVYTAGAYNDGNDNIVCYWKNGVVNAVETGGSYSPSVNSIFVAGGTVYIAGWYGGGCYWTGTNRTDLSVYQEATGIFVSGGIIYVSGCYSPAGNGLRACYWTSNGAESPVRHDLPVSY